MKKKHVTWTNIWKDINILCPEEMKKNPCKIWVQMIPQLMHAWEIIYQY